MKKNGYTGVEILIVILVIGIIYFIAANNVSYAFEVNYEEALFDQTVESIEKMATMYGMQNLELFAEEKDYYITVGELAEQGVILNDGEGKVIDPRNEDKTLNDLKVKLTYENEEVTAKLLA